VANVISSALQTFGIMLGVSLGLVFFLTAGTALWIRRTVQGKVYAEFLEPNQQITRELIRVVGNEKVQASDGADYVIVPSKVKWTKWPPGLPKWIQETVPMLYFVRNRPEPYDPMQQKAFLSAQSIRYITDEGMLRATWKDAREATEGRQLLGRRWSDWVVVVNTVLLIVVGFLVFRVSSDLGGLTKTVQSILKLAQGG